MSVWEQRLFAWSYYLTAKLWAFRIGLRRRVLALETQNNGGLRKFS